MAGLWRFQAQIRQQLKQLDETRAVFREHAPGVRKRTGKSVPRQVVEWLRLWAGRGRLEADEYFGYGLYDDSIDWPAKQRFLGRQREDDFVYMLDSQLWSAIANDKLVTQATLEHCGLPMPAMQAVYHPYRHFGAIPMLRTPDELARYLREQAGYPFVCKPVWGISGHDVNVVLSRDSEDDSLLLAGGTRIGVDAFARQRALESNRGHLLQEMLKPAPVIVAACGERICSVRVLVMMNDDGPELHKAFWKVVAGNNVTDNFHKGKAGNMIGTLDIDSGEVTGLVSGRGSERRELEHHPDTGAKLVGMTLPHWDQVRQVCLDGAAAVPGLRVQGWDVAICDRGAVLIEVNLLGGMDLPQVALNRGLYEGSYAALLQRHGLQ